MAQSVWAPSTTRESKKISNNPPRKTPKQQTWAKEIKWKPPDLNGFKTNFDGAMFKDTGEAGLARLGVVIRNHEGEIIAALSERIPQPPSVNCLELLAARWAAIFV